jgi:PAS domain S-box-containing protein
VQLRRTIEETLKDIVQFKVDQIANWRNERIADALIITKDPLFSGAVSRLMQNPTDNSVKSSIRNKFEIFKESYQYKDLFLVDNKGKIIAATTDLIESLDAKAYSFVELAIRTNTVVFSDFYYGDEDKDIHLDIVSPVIDGSGKYKNKNCVVILRINPDKFLYPLIQYWPAPSNTSETLLVRREGDEVVFLNELRHKKGTTLTLRLPITQKDLPAAMAVRGQKGIVEGNDYRGVKVISAIQNVPDVPWYLIAKTDINEAFSRIQDRKKMITLIVIVLIGFVGSMIGLTYSTRRKDIYKRLYILEVEEQALRKHFEYLVKYANDTIFLLDVDGNIVETNERAEDIYEYSYKEIRELNIRDVVAPEQRAMLEIRLEKEITEKGIVYESVHKRKDGTIFPVEVSARVIYVEGKKYFQGIIRDISERKQAEEKIKSLNQELHQHISELNIVNKELEQSNKELEQYAYVISHDLQEPLRMVSSFTQLLEKRYSNKLDQSADDYIKFAVDGAYRMQIMINDLLEYSRISTREINFKLVNLEEILGQIHRNLLISIQETGAIITHDELPIIYADATQMAQLFQNLISNAIKFRGVKSPHISISARLGDDKWFFSVRDNGIGITPEYYNRIFGIFQRLHTKDEYPGSGIGLAICKKIIEQHNGRIWVESQPGKGTTFYFTIPKRRESV